MSVMKNLVWNGSAWAEFIPHVWNGYGWEKDYEVVWNGSSWVQMPNWEWSGPYPGVVMTTNTAPAPFVVQRSSMYSSGYDAYKAFDQSYSGTVGWCATDANTSPWINFYFATPLKNIMLTVCNRTRATVVNGIIDSPIYGSNDGVNWTQIGTITGRDGALTQHASNHWCWNADDTYTWIRLAPTNWANKGASVDKYLCIGELYIYGYRST